MNATAQPAVCSHGRGDRGGVAVFVAICTVVLLAIAGLVLDGGGKLRATERADALALEAARAGGQALDPAAAVTGAAIRVDPAAAEAAATEYLRQAGVHGTVNVSPDRSELSVTVDTAYATRFLHVIGIGSMDVTGHGTATLLHGVDQPE
ncbi:pilus assembly protein TadG-related protein [Streptomyces sp. NPDC005722]